MRIRLVFPAMLSAFAAIALAGSSLAQAKPAPAAQTLGASDTARAATVPAEARNSDRWYCTPTGCAGAPSSSAGAAFGFAATALAVVWLSRKRPADRC
jgi:hypothetical protein